MDYLYKLLAKPTTVNVGLSADTVDIHLAEFVFKPLSPYGFRGEENEKVNRRIMARKYLPTKRAWDRAGINPNGAFFATELKDGALVYKLNRSEPMYYEESDLGRKRAPIVGALMIAASGTMRIYNPSTVDYNDYKAAIKENPSYVKAA